MEKGELIILLQNYIAGRLTEDQWQALSAFIQVPENATALIEALQETGMALLPGAGYEAERFEPILKRILAADKQPKSDKRAKVIKLRWIRWAAAASIILIAATAGYFIFKPGQKKEIAKTQTKIVNDVKAPEANRATITLSGGQKIYLDSLSNGSLVAQGNVNVEKLADGKISYKPGPSTSSGPAGPVYNTLTNPRGSKVIDMTLSDGSHIWLNAESSITYPVAFASNERRVEITGEAYFEVKHDETKPFIVKNVSKDFEVRVLGTQFNINTYDDQDAPKVTLLNGRVNVSKGGATKILKPGQQAIPGQGQINVTSDVDLEEVMAWKNGQFKFNNADIKTILNEVARWYDLDVVYEHGEPQGHYRGSASRDVSASQMLEIIKISGVKFRIEGRKLIIE